MNTFKKRLQNAVAAFRGQLDANTVETDSVEELEQPRATRGGTVIPNEDEQNGTNPSSGPIDAFDRVAAGLKDDDKGPKAKVLSFAKQRNWKWLGRVMQILNRYTELQGGNVASAVTLQVFLSFFPLLIIASSAVGFFVRRSNEDVAANVSQTLGITDPNVQQTIANAIDSASDGAGLAAIIGGVALLWSALGVASALQFAYNQAWQANGRGIKDRAIGLGWMLGAGVLVAASAVSTAVVGNLPSWLGLLTILAGILFTFAFWMFTSVLLPNVNLSWRTAVPGAILATAGMEAIKQAALLVPGAAANSESGAYGAFGAALALIAALFILGKLVVYSAVLNVVLYEAKYGTTTATIAVPTITAVTHDEAVAEEIKTPESRGKRDGA